MPAVIPLVAAVAGGAIASRGSRKAADTQVKAADAATAEQRRQFEITRADQMASLAQQRADQQPWMDAGRNALAQLLAGMAPSGEFSRSFGDTDFKADPGYQFRMQEGQKALNSHLAARGGLLSGAALKAASRYNQDMASQEYGNAFNRFNANQDRGWNRLASLANVGQASTSQVGQASQNAYGTIANAGANMTNNVSQNIIGAGNARASGYIARANALSNALNQAASSFGGFGGGGSGGISSMGSAMNFNYTPTSLSTNPNALQNLSFMRGGY